MIYLFNNPDKLARAVGQFKAKNPAGAVHRFDGDNWLLEQEKFEELLADGGGLFGEKNLIILSEIEELSDTAKERLEKSKIIVLWFQREIKKSPEFNLFALTDAFGSRDRANTWLIFQRALVAGISAEEIFWKLVWQVKTMLLVALDDEVKSLKPFVVQKARQFSRHFSPAELTQLSARLVNLYHETKKEEGRDFGLELEYLLLTI